MQGGREVERDEWDCTSPGRRIAPRGRGQGPRTKTKVKCLEVGEGTGIVDTWRGQQGNELYPKFGQHFSLSFSHPFLLLLVIVLYLFSQHWLVNRWIKYTEHTVLPCNLIHWPHWRPVSEAYTKVLHRNHRFDFCLTWYIFPATVLYK
jgi:hypothetical protein